VPAAKEKLNLETIEMRPFSTETVVNRFSCGKKPIDQFLKNKAEEESDK